jgi:hypothetical protein
LGFERDFKGSRRVFCHDFPLKNYVLCKLLEDKVI